MNQLNKYLQEVYDDDLMNNFAVRPSPIHGNGVFSQKKFKKGDFINTHFEPGDKITDFGSNLNHSCTPNGRSRKQGDGSYKTYADKDINPDDEVTLDYTKNKELEQPQKGWKHVEEKVIVREPPETDEIEIQVDTSDEASTTFSPKSDVRPAKESSDTVYGQGTAPNPEDETYLSLLKHSTKARVKVKVNTEEDDKDEDKIEVRVSSDAGKKMNPDLNPSYVAGPK